MDAVDRLPILNETYYRNVLCEIGGMFAIANKVDNIHKRPWIGFQSWRAAGRKVFLIVGRNFYLKIFGQSHRGHPTLRQCIGVSIHCICSLVFPSYQCKHVCMYTFLCSFPSYSSLFPKTGIFVQES